MIDPVKLPAENLRDFFDVEEFTVSIAQKLNEVISVISGSENEDTLEQDLYNLVETWKEEASELNRHPEMFPGFSKEVCSAIANDKIHCCSEIMRIIRERKK